MPTLLMIFSIAFCAICLAVMTPLANLNLYEINTDYFKKIKVKKFTRLFRGIGSGDCIYKDVKNYGIIIPMFILHIVGYVLSLLSVAVALILLFVFKIGYKYTAITLFAMAGIFMAIIALTIVICIAITKKRDKNLK